VRRAYRRLQLNENKTDLASFGKRSRLNKLVNMEQTVTIGASVIQPAAAVRDLGVYTRPRTQRDSTHRKSDIIMLLPTASDTSSSQKGTRRSAGPLVRFFEA